MITGFFKKLFGLEKGEKESWTPAEDLPATSFRDNTILTVKQRRARRLAEIAERSRHEAYHRL